MKLPLHAKTTTTYIRTYNTLAKCVLQISSDCSHIVLAHNKAFGDRELAMLLSIISLLLAISLADAGLAFVSPDTFHKPRMPHKVELAFWLAMDNHMTSTLCDVVLK